MKLSKTISIAGILAVMSALVVMAVGASAASAALPQFNKCKNVGAGNGSYSEYPCPERAFVGAGNGAWSITPVEAGEKIAFTSEGGEKNLYSTEILKARVKCASNEGAGEVTGPEEGTNTVTFRECEEVEPFKATCTTSGQASGVIQTEALSIEPVYLSAGETAAEGVGIALDGVGTEKVEAKFSCGGTAITVTGSVIGKVPASSVNTMSTTGELEFQCEPAGSTKQKYKEFWVGGVKTVDFLESNKKEACESEASADIITFAEAVELKA